MPEDIPVAPERQQAGIQAAPDSLAADSRAEADNPEAGIRVAGARRGVRSPVARHTPAEPRTAAACMEAP